MLRHILQLFIPLGDEKLDQEKVSSTKKKKTDLSICFPHPSPLKDISPGVLSSALSTLPLHQITPNNIQAFPKLFHLKKKKKKPSRDLIFLSNYHIHCFPFFMTSPKTCLYSLSSVYLLYFLFQFTTIRLSPTTLLVKL